MTRLPCGCEILDGTMIRGCQVSAAAIRWCPLHANAAATAAELLEARQDAEMWREQHARYAEQSAAEIKRLQEECERLQSQDPNPLHARIYKLETQLSSLRASHARLLEALVSMVSFANSAIAAAPKEQT